MHVYYLLYVYLINFVCVLHLLVFFNIIELDILCVRTMCVRMVYRYSTSLYRPILVNVT